MSNVLPGPARITSNVLNGDLGTLLVDNTISTPNLTAPSATSTLLITTTDGAPAYLKFNPGGALQTNQFQIVNTLNVGGTSTLASTSVNDLNVTTTSVMQGPVNMWKTLTVGMSANFGSYIAVHGDISTTGAVNTNFIQTSTTMSNLLITTTDTTTPAYLRLNVGGLVELSRISVNGGTSTFASLAVTNNTTTGSLSLPSQGLLSYSSSLVSSSALASVTTSSNGTAGLTNNLRLRNLDATNLNTGFSIANAAPTLPANTYTDSHVSFYSLGNPEGFMNNAIPGLERMTIGCNNSGGYLNFLSSGTGVTRPITINSSGIFASTGVTFPLTLTTTGTSTFNGLTTFNASIRGTAGSNITGGSITDTLTASGLLKGTAGLQISGGTTTDTLTASGQIRGTAGLNISGANSTLTTLTTTGLINAQNGLNVTNGLTTDLLTASSLISGRTINLTGLATLTGGAKITNGTTSDTLNVTGNTTLSTLTTSGLLKSTAGLTVTGGASTIDILSLNQLTVNGTTTLNSSNVTSLTASSSISSNGSLLFASTLSQSIGGNVTTIADPSGNWTIPGLLTGSNGASILNGLSSDTLILPSVTNLRGASSATTGSILTVKPATTFTDTSTTASSIATNNFNSVYIGSSNVAAQNTNVTTTNATTLYIAGAPTASTNQTLTNRNALWVASGTTQLNGGTNVTNGLTTDSLLVTGNTTFNGAFMTPVIMATSTADTNNANSTTSSGQFAGGLSVVKNGYFGGNLVSNAVAVGAAGVYSGAYLYATTNCTVGTSLSVGTSTTTSTLAVTATTAATSTTTGAMTVAGGGGFVGAVYANINVNVNTYFGRWSFNNNVSGGGQAGQWNNLLTQPAWVLDASPNINSEYRATGTSVSTLVSLNRAGGYIQIPVSGAWSFNCVLTVAGTAGLLTNNPIELRWYVMNAVAYRGSTAITNGTGATAGGLIGASTYISNGSELPAYGMMVLPAGARVSLGFLCNVTPTFLGGAPIFIQAWLEQQLT